MDYWAWKWRPSRESDVDAFRLTLFFPCCWLSLFPAVLLYVQNGTFSWRLKMYIWLLSWLYYSLTIIGGHWCELVVSVHTNTHTYAQNMTFQLVKNEIYRIKIHSSWPVAFHFILMVSVEVEEHLLVIISASNKNSTKDVHTFVNRTETGSCDN